MSPDQLRFLDSLQSTKNMVNEQNISLNAQNVADALEKDNLIKTDLQKTTAGFRRTKEKILALQSNLTLEQIRAKQAKLGTENTEMPLKEFYLEKISHWRKRKRMFKDIWDEELGIEYYEDIGVRLQTWNQRIWCNLPVQVMT
ncbi:hypothetical protein MKW92_026314 [Papaver armeniacum]|nr:hypothetical protein MKW92_026314 [Papaver armeniacum]